jgi:predicted DNA-binding transcriptional regulator AlpA
MSRRTGPRSLASRIAEAMATSKQKSEPEEPRIEALRFQPLARHKHVEQFLGVSANTVDRLIREEGLPCIRLGPGALRFDLETVRGWALGRQLQPIKVEEEGSQTDESIESTPGKEGPPS